MWIASCTSKRSATSSAQRICSGPAPTSSWILSPAPPCMSAVLDRARAGRRGAHQHRDVQRDRVERRPHRRRRLGRVRAEVPHRAPVLGDQRRQASGQCGIAHLRREQVHVTVDAAGRHDQPARVEHRGAGVEHDLDPVHRVRVPGSAERDDAAVADADRGRAHAEHRVEEQPADDRDLDAAPLRAQAQSIPHRVAPAGNDLVRARDLVALRLDAGDRCRPAARGWTQAPR